MDTKNPFPSPSSALSPVHGWPMLSGASTSFSSWKAGRLSPRPLWVASVLLPRASLTGPSSFAHLPSPLSGPLPRFTKASPPWRASSRSGFPWAPCLPSLAQHRRSHPSLSCLFTALLLYNFVSQTLGHPHSLRPLTTLLQIKFTLLHLSLMICPSS